MPPGTAPAATSSSAPPSTPPGTAVDPPHPYLRGPISADGVLWQNGRTTQEMREVWAAGARGAAAARCGLCTAPLIWRRGEMICWGCTHSELPIRWRRKVVELWLTGVQASEIARVVGGTKSAVLSYRRRAHLPARGSPLYALPDSERARVPRRSPATVKPQNRAFYIAAKKSLPAEPPEPAARRAKAARAKPAAAAPGGAVVVVAENAPSRPKGVPPHRARPGFTTCQYIIGKATFCAETVAELSPYCTDHTQLCFQPQRRTAA